MLSELHPDRVLFGKTEFLRSIAVCEHIAGKPRFIEKALELQKEYKGLIDVTLDLEDGIGATDAMTLLPTVIESLQSPLRGPGYVGVRLPPHTDSQWNKILHSLLSRCAAQIAYLTLPKIGSWKEFQTLSKQIERTCAELKISQSIPLHVLIESRSVLGDITKIAAHPWVEALDFGIMDFVSEYQGAIPLAAMHSPLQFDHVLVREAKSLLVKAALDHRKTASHNVTIRYDDPDQTYADAFRARNEFGFMRMWSIHPNQIKPILSAMQPPSDEVARAAEILTQAYEHRWEPIAYQNRLYDRASYRLLWNILKQAKQSGVKLPPTTDIFFSSRE